MLGIWLKPTADRPSAARPILQNTQKGPPGLSLPLWQARMAPVDEEQVGALRAPHRSTTCFPLSFANPRKSSTS